MTIKTKASYTKKLVMSSLVALFGLGLVSTAAVPAFAAGGFDEFGYNDQARVFVGSGDGSDRSLDGTVWGDPTYANDHLVMKWNAAWDECNTVANRDNPDLCAGAWTTNQWSGMAADGSKTTAHYKIIWVGSEGEDGDYWVDGGYSIWGNYEVIFDRGMNADHTKYVGTLVGPHGLGLNK